MDGFYLFGLEIKFYGLIMATAMLVGYFIACKLAKKRGVDNNDILTLAIIVLPLAVLGARIYYCIFSGYSYTFLEFIGWQNGTFAIRGLAIYGGVIGGFVGVLIFCAIKKSFRILLVLTDILVPVLILGQAMGRWGNFFNQEAYGYSVTNPSLQWFPFAVLIDGEGWHLATFFYESMWNLIGFVILLIVFNKYKTSGIATATYLIYYGLGRVLIEGLRTDSLYLWNTSIRVSQLLSAILILVGCAILVFIALRKRKKGVLNEKN